MMKQTPGVSLTIRPWQTDFLNISRFKLPTTSDKLLTRLKHNIFFYFGNYVALSALFFFLFFIFNPIIIIPLFILIAGCLYFGYIRDAQDPLIVPFGQNKFHITRTTGF